MNRRDLLKSIAAGAAVSAAEAMFPGVLFAPAGGGASTATAQTPPAEGGVAWRKTPCRFCGVGCGLLVGISNGRAVAVKGDPASPVNRGLCCVKGYHSVMALYGKDRLSRALVRKDGKLVPVPMKEALDLVASKMAETIKAHGKDAVAIYGSGQWTIPDGYVASKFMTGAIGTNNLEANARLCMSSAVTGFMTSFGLDEPLGCYDDIDHADTFVLWGNNMAEMHPVLFSRLQRPIKGGCVTSTGPQDGATAAEVVHVAIYALSQAVDRLVVACRAAEETIEGREQTLAKLKEETKKWETKRDEMWESYLKRKVNIAHDLDGLIRERQAIRDSVK